jgi:hypothetical protein
MKNDKNQLITQTESQRDPYRALATDFTIGKPDESRPTPGHGQHGESRQEEARLLSKRNPGKDALTNDKLPTATDKAGPPQRGSR